MVLLQAVGMAVLVGMAAMELNLVAPVMPVIQVPLVTLAVMVMSDRTAT